jgi:hypothetical protein
MLFFYIFIIIFKIFTKMNLNKIVQKIIPKRNDINNLNLNKLTS